MIYVSLKKKVWAGIAAGLTIDEKMNFVDWDDACYWADAVSKSQKVPFHIAEMTNDATGEVQFF
jgi:hypothetical protein|tara:strand:- start:385 stop:576 length:192 start_codon:yes stop_codon:yes gene_type:complete